MDEKIFYCGKCVHFCLNNNDGLMSGCRAFPDDIPYGLSGKDHTKIIKGQKGDYVYTPIKEE
jgi:hypothetical protein